MVILLFLTFCIQMRAHITRKMICLHNSIQPQIRLWLRRQLSFARNIGAAANGSTRSFPPIEATFQDLNVLYPSIFLVLLKIIDKPPSTSWATNLQNSLCHFQFRETNSGIIQKGYRKISVPLQKVYQMS